jgi:hypothetical protein
MSSIRVLFSLLLCSALGPWSQISQAAPAPEPVPAPKSRLAGPQYPDESDVARVRKALSRATRATIHRIGEIWDWEAPGGMRDTTGVVEGFVVLRTEPAPSASWLDSLRSILGDRTTYRQDDMLCMAIPEHVVRLYGPRDSVTVILSSGCGHVSVRTSGGFSLGGWGESQDALAELMDRVLPTDPHETSLPAMVLSAPHQYRDRDCTCDTRAREFAFYERPPEPISSPAPKVPSDLAIPTPTLRKVLLHVLVDRDGLPCRVKAVAGLDPFAVLAVDSVRRWRWKPATSKGEAICAWTQVPIDFGP